MLRLDSTPQTQPWLTQVLPLERLLRTGWNTNAYLRGVEGQHGRPFLVEDNSKQHISRISSLMKSDFDWCYIGIIALISREAELIGCWCEGCPCHRMDTPSPSLSNPAGISSDAGTIAVAKAIAPESEIVVDGVATVLVEKCGPKSRRKPRTPEQIEASACNFKCCRAPELAAGVATGLQERFMEAQAPLFNKLVSRAAASDRAELTSAWTTARSKLYGYLAAVAAL